MAKSTLPKQPLASGFFANTKRVYALLFVFAFLLYANTLGHGPVLDDLAVLETNTYVQQGLGGIPEICTTFYWKGSPSFAAANSGIYRPLSLVVFAVDWALTSGKTIEAHALAAARLGHWQNVLLFAALIVLLFRVLRKLLHHYPQQLALLITLLFAAHPVHTEVVANVKSLDEVLALLFSLLALNAAVDVVHSGARKAWLLVPVCFLLALLAKEGALLFVVVIPLALYFFTEATRPQLIRIGALLLGVLVVWLGLHSAVIYSDPAAPIVYSFNDNTLVLADGFGERLASATAIFGRYLGLLVAPLRLSYDYSFNDNPLTTFANLLVWLVLVVVVGLLVVAVRQFRQRTVVSFGILFFFVTFALTCNVFFLIGTTMAERLLFVPSLGFCMAVGWLLLRVTKGLNTATLHLHGASLALAVVLLVPSVVRTVTRNADWKSNTTLMVADAQQESGSARIYYNYGTVIVNRLPPDAPEPERFARADSAIAAFEQTLRIDSTYAQAWFQLGVAHFRRKEFRAAVNDFYAARRIDQRQDIDANLADALHNLGEKDSARVVLRRVLNRADAPPLTRSKLADVLLRSGDTLGGIALLREGLRTDSLNITNYVLLGNIAGLRKDYTTSREVLEKALQLAPENRTVLSALLLTCRFQGDAERERELNARYGGK